MIPSYKQVLVHLDATAAIAHRLKAARQIAERNEAALGALYATTPGFMELPYAPELGPSLASQLVELDDARREQALKAFHAAMAGSGAVASWSQAGDVPTTAAFAQQAIYADLLVLGQYNGDDEAAGAVPSDFVESVLSISGRPAVVIPYVGWRGSIGETVVIAWKETRESARAIRAALPFLQRARRVHVVAWGAQEEARIGGVQLDLASWLRVHGVEVTWHRGGPEPERIGEMLLSRTADLGADLLVMGAYGHSRALEWIVGGATRSVLGSMTLPVLMVH